MKLLKVVKVAILSLYLLCGVALVVFLLPASGLKAKAVATGSMTPAIPKGSLVIIHKVSPYTLKVGQVVTYINPANNKETITHRIVKTETKSGLPYFVTKGDANSVSDPEIVGGSIVGQVVFHAPYLGAVMTWAKKPLGLAVFVILPGLLIIVDEARRMNRILATSDSSPKDSDPPIPPSGKGGERDKVPQLVAQTRRPTMDGVMHKLAPVAILIPVLAVGSTMAALKSNTVTLTNNTITTATASASPTPSPTSSPSPSPSSSPTPGGSTTTITNVNIVDVTNTNIQIANTGWVSNVGNTNGGATSSGDASNSNTTTTIITSTF